ncbi:MAG: transposase [Tannerellaceae bacterium]
MGKERTQYDCNFKDNAFKLSYERKNVSVLAREPGISSNLIYRWRKEAEEYGDGSFPGNGIQKMTPEEKELADLKEKMRILELENEIFKKAVHIFSRDNR